MSWVGETSLEVTVWLEQNGLSTTVKITQAYFVLAVRNQSNDKKAYVNPLKLMTAKEEVFFEGGAMRHKNRIKQLDVSSIRKAPDEEEQNILYNLYNTTIPVDEINLAKRVLPKNGIWMDPYKYNFFMIFGL